ncbi:MULTISPECIES: winged helix-turn-helix transcriptional regulator [Leisingera]|uniref:winged helix-turn-helix transcriptional regulator n=1 Tax=Leisingera TaxID=191028 RepID=UPI0015730C35|nr:MULTISPECIES: winged helix-turn-helix transcriptional regulator [Leisingera]MBY6059491.1 winged helix-turn-helix transcriptional regulator [Leisingera daeponensis]NSY41569.1 transcriptional regulator [Leisingera sp. ANG59]
MTNNGQSPRIRYDEGCLAAHALNLTGDRWALLVVRELMFAPKRFQMIRKGLPGITASVLTGRLEQLAAAGVVDHDERLGIYALTDAGRGLLPVLEALCRWALTVPGHDPSRFISPSALMISLGVTLMRGRAEGREALAGFDISSEAFKVHLSGGKLHTTAVTSPKTGFVLSGTGNTLAAAVYGSTPLADLSAKGIVHVEGDITAAEDFLSLFSLRRDT